MSDLAFVNYHLKRPETQAFRFDVGGIAGQLEAPELDRTLVDVVDLRCGSASVAFDEDGITFEHYASATTEFAPADAWQTTYEAELGVLLRERIGAADVQVFDHTIRVDDPSAPRRPARNVHNDYSSESARQRLRDLVGYTAARDYESGHYGFVNVWRPIVGPVHSSPLGFIRPRSIAPDDWMGIELIYPDRRGQILGVAANPAHEWFYWSAMTPAEVAIFNIFDNRGRPFLGHSALDLATSAFTPTVRKSIESRTLVRYR